MADGGASGNSSNDENGQRGRKRRSPRSAARAEAAMRARATRRGVGRSPAPSSLPNPTPVARITRSSQTIPSVRRKRLTYREPANQDGQAGNQAAASSQAVASARAGPSRQHAPARSHQSSPVAGPSGLQPPVVHQPFPFHQFDSDSEPGSAGSFRMADFISPLPPPHSGPEPYYTPAVAPEIDEQNDPFVTPAQRRLRKPVRMNAPHKLGSARGRGGRPESASETATPYPQVVSSRSRGNPPAVPTGQMARMTLRSQRTPTPHAYISPEQVAAELVAPAPAIPAPAIPAHMSLHRRQRSITGPPSPIRMPVTRSRRGLSVGTEPVYAQPIMQPVDSPASSGGRSSSRESIRDAVARSSSRRH